MSVTHISSDMCSLQACVIYRDYDDGPRGLQVADFVGKQNLDSMTSFLGGVHAYGGADECEDIAGGLRVSCTRLNKAHLRCPETEHVALHMLVNSTTSMHQDALFGQSTGRLAMCWLCQCAWSRQHTYACKAHSH